MDRKMSLKGKVIINAHKEFERDRGSPYQLNKALDFKHELRLKDVEREKCKKFLKLLGFSNREENRLNLETLIANLLNKRSRKPVIVSLSPNEWKLTQYTMAGQSTIKLINKLQEHGYIKMERGYYRTDKGSRKTRIWATEKLLNFFPETHSSVIYEPVELVELRDANGNPKKYNEKPKTRRIRSVLETVNEVNGTAEIKYNKYILFVSLVAIFNRKFTLYGRLHTRGIRHYQGFDEEERAEITINGEPVVELDFSGLHPHLLYAKEELQLSEDPYSVILPNPEFRDFLKKAFLSLLNATGRWVENKRTKSKWWMTAEQAAQAGINKRMGYNDKLRKELNRIGITNGKQIIDIFKKVHEPIAHYFCSDNDTGLKIMNLDAQIALDIVDHFAKQNIPILAIHDSFIVPYQYEDELEQTMQESYKKHTGGLICPIK